MGNLNMQLNTLKEKYPFPLIQGVKPFYFSLDGGGRETIIKEIQEQNIELVLEIGSFLCGSTIQWLESSNSLTVIGVDPWEGNFASILDRYNKNPIFDSCFQKIEDRQEFIQSVCNNGPYLSALANVKKYKERFIPIQAYSPKALYEIASMGITPQLIYFDSNKVLDDLDVCMELFPEAILSGDDWTWGAERGFPVQKAVKEFCQQHKFSFTAKRATWMIHKTQV
ncbi:MAG: hypothetical protein SWY16_10435 [Cyanobacteriota bacterium]|nr:hypothetical protein [Cyanobacteriota bacterium]